MDKKIIRELEKFCFRNKFDRRFNIGGVSLDFILLLDGLIASLNKNFCYNYEKVVKDFYIYLTSEHLNNNNNYNYHNLDFLLFPTFVLKCMKNDWICAPKNICLN